MPDRLLQYSAQVLIDAVTAACARVTDAFGQRSAARAAERAALPEGQVAPAWLPARPSQWSLHHPVAREHEHCKWHWRLPPACSVRKARRGTLR